MLMVLAPAGGPKIYHSHHEVKTMAEVVATMYEEGLNCYSVGMKRGAP